ncbi:MJ1255/VC2487 family glycosyltransferase [Salinispirillum marinum]|uniref:MJ1255/VC2487 family glycosyltransferase n=2 Tax=Saccharospirillaceae TaxID=255527 RepID=A0ABV8BJX3_9GAMM
MKILYGVQATGNGHITRARVMEEALAARGISVDYIFSGRPAEKLFDMEAFGEFTVRKGLTFTVESGRIDYFKTFWQADLRTLWKDMRTLNVQDYDIVITDFEPITAWAARWAGKPCIGLGHQYAFRFPIPKAQDSWLARQVMRWFAPASISFGAHWHHFGAPILPPLIHVADAPESADPDRVLVYLPFEDLAQVLALIEPLENYLFDVFTDAKEPGQYGHIHIHPFGRDNFQQCLRQCESVICNAGFELASEALHLGKRILVKPVHGQMEQASNALALKQLGYGTAMDHLSMERIAEWLSTAPVVQVSYPDVAAAVVEWLLAGEWSKPDDLSAQLWRTVESV